MIVVYCMILCVFAAIVLACLGFWENSITKFWYGALLCPFFVVYSYFVLTAPIEVSQIDKYNVYFSEHPDTGKILYYLKDDQIVLLKDMKDYSKSEINYENYEKYRVKITKYKKFYYLIFIVIPEETIIEKKIDE